MAKEKEDKFSLKMMIDGSILTKDKFLDQLPFILFLTFLAILYISNRLSAEKMLRETSKLQTEVREMRAESITRASRLMYMSKQSEVAKMVKEKGLELEEAVRPPKKLIVK
jgi:hypothetical protein